jgi:hypothetical protein
VVYRDVTRQAKGLYRLKHIGALGSGLAYLSRYNSGWFCHSKLPNVAAMATVEEARALGFAAEAAAAG